MKKILPLFAFFIFSACSAPTPNIEYSDKEVEKVSSASNQFAFDFYHQIKTENAEKNIFYSPYSIFSALAIAYEGAEGKTAEEMEKVFSFPQKETLQKGFFGLVQKINKKGKKYDLNTANALWVQKDYELMEEYETAAKNFYAGKVENLDFIKSSEKSRKTINQFVSEKTNKKIPELIPKGALGALTRLVITNAVYFKGDWKYQFDKSKEKPFYLLSGDSIQTDMMSFEKNKKFLYAEDENFQVLSLPYKGDELEMIVFLPKKEEFTAFENSFSQEIFEIWRNKLKKQEVVVHFPSFKFSAGYELSPILKKLGMNSAFSETKADFSGISGGKDLFISSILHKSFIEVNQEGTEAAAATAVVMQTKSAISMEDLPPVFNANHPFIFVIQEKTTQNILFVGRIMNPKK
jgi:serpin B